jgi:hypothetical protein
MNGIEKEEEFVWREEETINYLSIVGVLAQD